MNVKKNKNLQLNTIDVMILQQALTVFEKSGEDFAVRLQEEIHDLQKQLDHLHSMRD